MKKISDDSLSFDFDAPPSPPGSALPLAAPPIAEAPKPSDAIPQWKWADDLYPHTDFIEAEAVCIVTFEIDELEKVHSWYSTPVFKVLFVAFKSLKEHRLKSMRDQSFTIFAGDALGFHQFVVGIATPSASVVNHMAFYLRSVPGQLYVESGSSRDFMPTYRYDKGHIIYYGDSEDAGKVYNGSGHNFDSGLTIYSRDWVPADIVGRRKSAYAKLVSPTQ